MSKPFSVANLRPRGLRQVPEDVARKLEEEAEAKGNGIAGLRDRESPPLVSPAPVLTAPPPIAPAMEIEPGPSTTEQRLPTHHTGTMRVPRVRKDGVQTRSTSIHLPVILGRQLAMHCAERGFKQNDVIVEALQSYLRDA